MKEINITENEAQQRLDRFLRKFLTDMALGEIYKLFRKNKVKVNSKKAKENYMLQENDIIQLYIDFTKTEKTEKTINKEKATSKVDIIYEDQNILLVNKPIGLLTHPDEAKEQDTMLGRGLDYLLATDQIVESLTFSPSICNRLDRNTGGIVIIAKNYKTLKSINELIRQRSLKKLYICIVKGQLNGEGELKSHLTKDSVTNKVTISNENNDTQDSKEIHTIYRVLKNNSDYSLLEVELITGRSHQIRAHFASIGHPIIGDAKYGDSQVNSFFKARFGFVNQYLYAYKLCFNEVDEHLEYLKGKEFTTSLPEKYQEIKNTIF